MTILSQTSLLFINSKTNQKQNMHRELGSGACYESLPSHFLIIYVKKRLKPQENKNQMSSEDCLPIQQHNIATAFPKFFAWAEVDIYCTDSEETKSFKLP